MGAQLRDPQAQCREGAAPASMLHGGGVLVLPQIDQVSLRT